jgi:hypothetical protein
MLADAKSHGPEADNIARGSPSAQLAYADLRAYHHIRNIYDGTADYVAIMQYRRMFFIGKPSPWRFSVKSLKKLSVSQNESEIVADANLRAAYLLHLKSQSDRVLYRMLHNYDFIANRMDFRIFNLTVQNQYLDAVKTLYPENEAYTAAWFDLRCIVEKLTSPSTVRDAFDGYQGYFNNCFVSSWPSFCMYYDFLFEVIDKLEQYRSVPRLYGYLAERVLGLYFLLTSANVVSQSILKFE